MSLVSDIYAFLEAQGIAGGSTQWPLSRRAVHDQSDQLVVITEDGGLEPETPAPQGTLGDSAMKEPAVQVRVRGLPWKADDAQAKAQEAFDALHGLLRTEINGTYYNRVKAQTPEPLFIGYDSKNRPEFTISFRARRPVSAA